MCLRLCLGLRCSRGVTAWVISSRTPRSRAQARYSLTPPPQDCHFAYFFGYLISSSHGKFLKNSCNRFKWRSRHVLGRLYLRHFLGSALHWLSPHRSPTQILSLLDNYGQASSSAGVSSWPGNLRAFFMIFFSRTKSRYSVVFSAALFRVLQFFTIMITSPRGNMRLCFSSFTQYS